MDFMLRLAYLAMGKTKWGPYMETTLDTELKLLSLMYFQVLFIVWQDFLTLNLVLFRSPRDGIT